MDYDIYFMKIALAEAEKAFAEDEVPVGAVIVINSEVVATAYNTRESLFDPTAHAEIIALRAAAQKINNWRLTDATLYVTKEPCIMCAGAMINARLGRLVYGCIDIKGGAVNSLYRILSDARLNHQVEVAHEVLKDECAEMLQRFFRARR
jgi:tRNA(adenine34) deaminase